jgi:CHAT domain-containing protein
LLTLLLLSAIAAAQQNTAPATPVSDAIAKSRENLRGTEAAHPGNTTELAGALHDLVGTQLEAGNADTETLMLVQRELTVAEATDGARSKAYVNALGDSSETYVALSRAAEARPLAERAMEIAAKEFPESEEGINAADELAYVCLALADYPCALRADETAVAAERKPGPDHDWDLAVTLSNMSDLKKRMGDEAGTGAAIEEAVAAAMRSRPNDPAVAVMENNLATHFIRSQNFPDAIIHLNRALDIARQAYGPDSSRVLSITGNLASLYSRSGQFPLAWKAYEAALGPQNATVDAIANQHGDFAISLAAGGDLPRAIDEGLLASRMGRESFVLQARTLPERQALAYDQARPRGLDTALSILARHPDVPISPMYLEMVRSRALVADEMARRQRNLNTRNDPAVGQLLDDLSAARSDLLTIEQSAPRKSSNRQAIADATARMEAIERALAERSADARNDERANAVTIEDLRNNLPPHSVLISYVAFLRRSVEKVDPLRSQTPSYLVFVLHPDTGRIQVHDLGDAKSIEELVYAMRASVDTEAHAGGLNATRNERAYREAGGVLRARVWDPLRADLGDARLAVVVPDGVLNLVPFSSLPEGNGYLVEHGPVIHTLSSERDLIHSTAEEKKSGLLAIGNPAFDAAGSVQMASLLRDTPVSCEEFRKLDFHPLPGASDEVKDIGATWRRWNSGESLALVTGTDATRARFLDEAPRSRILHVATHAFLLDRSCGDGNPLLHSGLVFAGANQSRQASILTAQQIASLDLSGVDWAVLSACNTGNGELRDGEGVLGLERAFHIAGVRSVVMTLWPVDDHVTGSFVHELYIARFGRHASSADAVWYSARKLLVDRRTAGLSTHPWYWAGFVGSGGWE